MTLALSTLYFGRMNHARQRVERLSILSQYRVENSKCMYWRYRNILVAEKVFSRVFSEKGKKKILGLMCFSKQKNAFTL